MILDRSLLDYVACRTYVEFRRSERAPNAAVRVHHATNTDYPLQEFERSSSNEFVSIVALRSELGERPSNHLNRIQAEQELVWHKASWMGEDFSYNCVQYAGTRRDGRDILVRGWGDFNIRVWILYYLSMPIGLRNNLTCFHIQDTQHIDNRENFDSFATDLPSIYSASTNDINDPIDTPENLEYFLTDLPPLHCPSSNGICEKGTDKTMLEEDNASVAPENSTDVEQELLVRSQRAVMGTYTLHDHLIHVEMEVEDS